MDMIYISLFCLHIVHIIIHIGTQMVNWLYSQATKLTPTQLTIGLPGLSVGRLTRQTLHGSHRMSGYKPHLSIFKAISPNIFPAIRQYSVELREHPTHHVQQWVRRHLVSHHPQKRQALHNVYLLLSWRLLHWPNIKPTLAEWLL